MTTYAELVDEVISNLQGYSIAQEQFTSLADDLAPWEATISLSDASQVSKGVIEVDQELMLVSSVDTTSNTATVIKRGYRGTTNTTHSIGAIVTRSPAWPRSMVARQINSTISSVYPQLFGVYAAPVFSADAVIYQFALPDLAERVVDVRFHFTDFEGWQRSTKWEIERLAPAAFGSTAFVSIYDRIPIGSTVQVLYAARPQPLVNDDDDFSSVSGLDAGAKDVIVLGTCAWMAQFIGVARLPSQSAAADAMGQQRQPGTEVTTSRALQQLYLARLAAEAASLAVRFPPRSHKVR